MMRRLLRAVIRWALAPTPGEQQGQREWLRAARAELLRVLPTIHQREGGLSAQ